MMHDMDAVMSLAQRTGVAVIEDCAQAHGARRGVRRAGSFGDAATFSFYPTKNLGAIGDGGAITTRNSDIAERARRLRQYGWGSKYRVETSGARNSRLDELQAAVLRGKLPQLDAWNDRRREIATLYSRLIHHPRVTTPPVMAEDYVGHLYVVEADSREALRQHLLDAGIASDVHYPIPDHLQPILSDRAWRSLPATEEAARRVLTLPCFPELTDAEVESVAHCVNSW
jgi:dTDP-4-amino-4,6-dideoxygalactose transaminase